MQMDDALDVVSQGERRGGERAQRHAQIVRRRLEPQVVVGRDDAQHAAVKELEDVRV